jgi:hypothetical protein
VQGSGNQSLNRSRLKLQVSLKLQLSTFWSRPVGDEVTNSSIVPRSTNASLPRRLQGGRGCEGTGEFTTEAQRHGAGQFLQAGTKLYQTFTKFNQKTKF